MQVSERQQLVVGEMGAVVVGSLVHVDICSLQKETNEIQLSTTEKFYKITK